MKTQRLLMVLTILNGALLAFLLTRLSVVEAQDVEPVLRAQALEIVDAEGRVRASITVIPGDPSYVMPDGTLGYSETVLLRLINSKGRPNVKIAATELGSGIGLGGENDPTYVQVLASRASTSLKLTDGDGRERLIKPEAPPPIQEPAAQPPKRPARRSR